MSIIRAGTTTTTALTSIGNTDGTIQLQVNGTTPSVTLNTLGAVGVGSTPNFGTSGQVLISGGSTAAPTWGTAGTATSATTATNIAGGGAGQIPYNTGSGTTAFVAAGTSGQVLQSNGTSAPSWAAAPAGGFSTAQVFTSSGTFTVPSSGKFKVTIVGGGASGGRSGATNSAGGSGGGAGTVIKWFSGATPGDSATVTIGAGGAAVTSNGTNGNNGGASSFVLSGFTTLTANGGTGGNFTITGGSGGSASGGDINVAGQRGGDTIINNDIQRVVASVGGSSLFGLGAAWFSQASGGSPPASSGFGAGGVGIIAGDNSRAGTGGICIVEF